MTDVPKMLKKIKALEATVEERNTQLLLQQQQLTTFQASKRKRLYGLNDVKTLGTRLYAMRDSHVNFCTKYAGGKSTPKTLSTRTRLLNFVNEMIRLYEEEFAEHLEAIKSEEAQPKKKKAS